jgi:predicted type IV restriction endonuclease
MAHVPDLVKRLVDRFTQQSDTIRSPDYNETLIRVDFINPLMRELGWDIDNSAGYAERYRVKERGRA